MAESRSVGSIIALPKGGGAIAGLGEKFSADPHTGTASFTIPIAVPNGRNGFQPQLALVYSTAAGNGPFGLGWSLSVPGISRKTSAGVPRYDDDRDTFLLSGAEDLVEVAAPAWSSARWYRPRTEGLFARVVHDRSGITDHWDVWTKDGVVSRYGVESQAPAVASGPPAPATIADPRNARNVFAWRLTRTTDPFGNIIEYDYRREALRRDAFHEWDQSYLETVRYADHGSRSAPQFLVSVRFVYEPRPDPFSEYRSGFEIRTTRRCTRIDVMTHPGVAVANRSYRLVYLDQTTADPGELPINGFSLLERVLVEGTDGAASQSMPPLTFRYTKFEPEIRRFVPLAGETLPATSLADPDRELVDLFGSGLPDLLELGDSARYWRNRGDGRFDVPRPLRDAPAGHRLSDAGVQMIDATGDGRPDLLVSTPEFAGVFPMRFGAAWDERSARGYAYAPTFSLDDPDVRLVDLDGDGITDVLRSGTRLECYFNDRDPKKAWRETRWLERGPIEEMPDVMFSDARVHLADMTGDGLQDVVLVHDGNVEYWPNLGRGRWGRRVHMRASPRFGVGYQPQRVLVGDLDGDGLADIAYVASGRVTVWINQSGNGWGAPLELYGTPSVANLQSVRIVDLFGNGVGGLLWTSDAALQSVVRLYFLDLTGGFKPYLLDETDNHAGAITRIEYAPSTRYYLADWDTPGARWRTPLPIPVQVVARVEVVDRFSAGKLTTEYRYHHGYWDGEEREFRGFGLVEQLDTETFERYDGAGLHGEAASGLVREEHFSPPTRSKTWFHLGAVGDEFDGWDELPYDDEFWPEDPRRVSRPAAMTAAIAALPRRVKRDALRALRGQVLRTELYADDDSGRAGRPYTVTEALVGVREEASSPLDPERPRIFFPHVLARRTTQWERGADPLTQIELTDSYDEFGRPARRAMVGVPRGRDYHQAIDPAQPSPIRYLAVHALTEYATRDDASRYIVDRVARVTEFETIGDARLRAIDFGRAALSGAWDRPERTIGQAVNFYDGQAFAGSSIGQLGDYGALVRSESLVLTDDILTRAYGTLGPAYLTSNAPSWTAEYPIAVRTTMPARAGYVARGGVPGFVDGLYAVQVCREYDFHGPGTSRGLVTVARDPLQHDTTITYDRYQMLPETVTDPSSLVTTAGLDYRLLQPNVTTDPNLNRTRVEYSPLGLVTAVWVEGKANATEGDRNSPSVRIEYDLRPVETSGSPLSVRTIQRVHHDTELDVPALDRGDVIERREYYDGFGRRLQLRTQADSAIYADESLPTNERDLTFGNAVLPRVQPAVGGRVRGFASQPGYVAVSGWQTYDNKGRVVETFEPYFDVDWRYDSPETSERGERLTTYFDPRGQVVRTIKPDGSERRIVYGVPGMIAVPALTTPGVFEPTPWESYTYDANDNAGRTHAAAASAFVHHWNTPTSAAIDALGRTVLVVERNKSAPTTARPNPPLEELRTVSVYDIRGNLTTIVDTLGRTAFTYTYDLAGNTLSTDSLDGGRRVTVMNAAGAPVEHRDARGAVILRAYEASNRPVGLWARDDAASAVTMRERVTYGEDPALTFTAPDSAVARNIRGQPYRHDDEAGSLVSERYDFKGNVVEKTRQVIDPRDVLAVFPTIAGGPWRVSPYRVDWTAGREPALGAPYRTTIDYDALNRTKVLTYPESANGSGRAAIRPRYNRGGALQSVSLGTDQYVDRIAYNARGQRTLIAYGNGVWTRYAYDPLTFRLARIRTESFVTTTAGAYEPSGSVLQDIAYEYDLSGNLLTIVDRTPACGVQDNIDAARFTALATELSAGDALVRRFEYDALYRLTHATGRECDRVLGPRPWQEPGWSDPARCGFTVAPDPATTPQQAQLYAEDYEYDAAGNLVRLRHSTPAGPPWVRELGMGGLAPQDWAQESRTRWAAWTGNATRWSSARSNQLTHVGDDDPAANQTHRFDANGNLVRENQNRFFEWDALNRLKAFRDQAGTAEPSKHAHYLYDAGGQRVMKIYRTQGGAYEVTVYIDGAFEHFEWTAGATRRGNNRVHVMDGERRVAAVRIGLADPSDQGPGVQYVIGDHLGSASIVVGGTAAGDGALINREEFFPYGETSFGSFARKRYRFCGRERDAESGLSHHSARLYAPHLFRWASCDPAGYVDGMNLYSYSRNNPITYRDVTGRQAEPRTRVPRLSQPPDLDWQLPSSFGGPLPREPGEPRVTEETMRTDRAPIVWWEGEWPGMVRLGSGLDTIRLLLVEDPEEVRRKEWGEGRTGLSFPPLVEGDPFVVPDRYRDRVKTDPWKKGGRAQVEASESRRTLQLHSPDEEVVFHRWSDGQKSEWRERGEPAPTSEEMVRAKRSVDDTKDVIAAMGTVGIAGNLIGGFAGGLLGGTAMAILTGAAAGFGLLVGFIGLIVLAVLIGKAISDARTDKPADVPVDPDTSGIPDLDAPKL